MKKASKNLVRMAGASVLLLVGTVLVDAGSSSEIRQNGRDAISKHNPNAALIGQMLGGAQSLDIGGLGNAGVSPRHYAYCVRKYGSYRFNDNSFLQFSGVRTQCVSPYFSDGN